MAIGKYCQICGEPKRASEVVAEAHGIVVTAPCLMDKVYGDPPEEPERVRAMARFCAVCGTEQPEALPTNCVSCNAALGAEAAAADLAAAGEGAAFSSRVLAFAIDLVVVAVLSTLMVMAIGRLETSMAQGPVAAAEASSEEAVGEIEEVNIYSIARYGSALLIFIGYHALFVLLLGATPGKLAFGLKVVLKNGSTKIGAGKCLARSALYLFTIYVTPIGLLPLAFQEPASKWLEIIERDAMFHNSLTDTEAIKPKG